MWVRRGMDLASKILLIMLPSYPSVRNVRILIKSYMARERLYVLEALSKTLLTLLSNISMKER